MKYNKEEKGVMNYNGQPTLVSQEESIREIYGRRPVIVSDVHRYWLCQATGSEEKSVGKREKYQRYI